MRNRVPFSLLIFSIIVLSLSVACTTGTSTSTTSTPITTTSTTQTSTTSTQVTQANWWDKLGTPQYGGTFILRSSSLDSVSLDSGVLMGPQFQFWLDRLFCPGWAVDRSVNSFKLEFIPVNDYDGILAESWEQTDPTTITVNLRQGIHWQDKSPVNGREFVATDVQDHYDRLLGTGSGYTTPDPFFTSALSNIDRVVATDKYTVQFKFKQPNIFEIYDVLNPTFGSGQIQAPEWAKQYGTDFSQAATGGGPGGPPGGPDGGGAPPTISSDWKTVVGTGPWMLTDAVAGTSLTYSKNPNYWGHDERYPQNQLPYIDTFKELAVPDMSTAIAALRTGKVDMIAEGRFGPTWQDAQAIANTNPEIQQAWWSAPGATLEMRVDHEPFTDIRVRQALQMAVDRQTIAKTYYGGTVNGEPAGLASPLATGWVTPYDQWPDDLKQIYSYNPDQAKTLLDDAGYPGGLNTECMISNMDDLQILQVIQAEFRDIGVEMSINNMDMPTFSSLLSTGKNDQMSFTMASGTFTIPSQAILTYDSQYKDNHCHVNDPDYDALVTKFQSAGTIDDAKPIFIQADMYAFQHCWSIQVCPIAVPVLWQSYLHGYSGEQQQGELPGFYAARMWLTK